MTVRGKLLKMDPVRENMTLTIVLTGADPEQTEKYLSTPDRQIPLDIDIRRHTERRSLTANAYYWTVLGKLARKLHISAARLHNIMLRDYPSPVIVDGRTVNISIPERDYEKVYEMETIHLKPTDEIFHKDGEAYRWYYLLNGSHTMSMPEFSELLDHLIEEAKEQGIETATPDQIAHMKQLEAAERARHDS